MRRVGLVLFLWLSAATAALAADATTALTPADVAYLTKLGQSQKELAANKPARVLKSALNDIASSIPCWPGLARGRAGGLDGPQGPHV